MLLLATARSARARASSTLDEAGARPSGRTARLGERRQHRRAGRRGANVGRRRRQIKRARRHRRRVVHVSHQALLERGRRQRQLVGEPRRTRRNALPPEHVSGVARRQTNGNGRTGSLGAAAANKRSAHAARSRTCDARSGVGSSTSEATHATTHARARAHLVVGVLDTAAQENEHGRAQRRHAFAKARQRFDAADR